MPIVDEERIDAAVLALLWLTLLVERRAWKGFDRAVLDRLHAEGMIADPVNGAERRRAAPIRCALAAAGLIRFSDDSYVGNGLDKRLFRLS